MSKGLLETQEEEGLKQAQNPQKVLITTWPISAYIWTYFSMNRGVLILSILTYASAYRGVLDLCQHHRILAFTTCTLCAELFSTHDVCSHCSELQVRLLE